MTQRDDALHDLETARLELEAFRRKALEGPEFSWDAEERAILAKIDAARSAVDLQPAVVKL